MSLLIERVAETACDMTWFNIRQKLDLIQVAEFHTDTHRFFKRNELTTPVRQVLNSMKIPVPKAVVAIEKLP
jgi:hypothetical protein